MLSRCSHDVVKMSCQKPNYYLKVVPVKIGHTVNELRLEGGFIHQKDLSLKSGLSERTILNAIDQNEVAPNPHTLRSIGRNSRRKFSPI